MPCFINRHAKAKNITGRIWFEKRRDALVRTMTSRYLGIENGMTVPSVDEAYLSLGFERGSHRAVLGSVDKVKTIIRLVDRAAQKSTKEGECTT
jgi:hypothetical protein